MIYLFDEARERQKGYLWDSKKFAEYASYIKPIYNFDEYRLIKREVFAPGNTILYHESFSLNQPNQHEKDFLTIKNDLSEYSKEKGLLLAMFSGSEQDRRLNGNVAHLPVSYLYSNLECFIKHSKTSEPDLRHLLFGDNYEIEEKISELLNEEISKSFDNHDSHSNVADCSVVVINTDNEYALTTFDIDESDEKTIFSNDISGENLDEKLDKYAKEWLGNKEYDAIVIPLCFGNSLSDFNGLRLAVHIRCTDTVNRLKPIFIFGLQRYDLMIGAPYYDILKTKDVALVGYDFMEIKGIADKKRGTLTMSELLNEMGKMYIPYHEDGHSVANEWAINRWASAIDAEDEEIQKIISKLQSDIYFKYLNTIYPAPPVASLPELKLKLDIDNQQSQNYYSQPKILLVDDEAEKGWYEIFCKIIFDINKCDFFHLDDEFDGKNQKEVLEIIKNKIIEEDINVVILDFRILPCDKNETNIKNITGYKALLDIKNTINAGIQVIILSATNKVWNLLSLQRANADGFILKERPSDIDKTGNTTSSIEEMVKCLSYCCNRVYLKDFFRDKQLVDEYWGKKTVIKKHGNLKEQLREQLLISELQSWFNLSCEILRKDSSDQNMVASFIYSFSVIECYSNRIVRSKPEKVKEDLDGVEVTKYKWKFVDDVYLKDYVTDNKDDLLTEKPSIPWAQKIMNAILYKKQIACNVNFDRIQELVRLRNSIIHPNIAEQISSSTQVDVTALVDIHRIAFGMLINQ